jgi:hypothetical protein
MLGDMNLAENLLLHPRHIASYDRDFQPVFSVGERQIERRDQLAAKYAGMAKGYWQLPKASRDRVNAVLELDRLNGKPSFAGKVMAVENAGAQECAADQGRRGGHARFSRRAASRSLASVSRVRVAEPW